MRSRNELDAIKNFVDSTYSNFGNKLIVDTNKKYDPTAGTALGFCFKHVDPVSGAVVYKIDCSKIGIERTDFRIMMHEYAHIYLGHLDGIHEELDTQVCNVFRDHRNEIIDLIVDKCGIDTKTADRLIERIIDDPELNHQIHNIAMDMECNSRILSKEDVEEMEMDITSILPKYEEEILKKAIDSATSQDYKDKLKDHLNKIEAEAKIKLIVPERYSMGVDANDEPIPFPSDLTYADYLILIITHIDQFVKMMVSIQMGGNGDTNEITKEDIQNALSGMLNKMRQRTSQNQSEAYRQGYQQALRDARSGRVDPQSAVNDINKQLDGQSQEYKDGFKQGFQDKVEENLGSEDFKQGYNDGYRDEMQKQQQSGNQQGQSQDQNSGDQSGQQDQASSSQGNQQNQSNGQQQSGGNQQSQQGQGQKSDEYNRGYEAGQRSAQNQQGQGQDQNSQQDQSQQQGQNQGQQDYQNGYQAGQDAAEDAMNQSQQQGQGQPGNGGQQPGQGQGSGQGQSQEMQDYNDGYQQALRDLANSQGQGQGQGLSNLLQSMGISSGGGMQPGQGSQPGNGGQNGEGLDMHNKQDPNQKKGEGREQQDSLNPFEGVPGTEKDHCSDSREDADKKREMGQIQAGGGVGMGRGGGPEATREVDKFADDVDMALTEVLNDVKSRVVKSEIQRDMMKLYNRGIIRSVIAPSLSRKVTISTKPKLVFLIDISGSMDTRLIDRILKTISKSLKKLNRDLRYDIITWSTCLGEHLKNIDPRRGVPRISCGGGTEMARGMEYFKEHYGPEAILVLISDFCDSLDDWHRVELTMPKYSIWGFNYGDNRYSYRRDDWDWKYFKQRNFSDYGYDD
ncbi:MAG: VWA domain-containing protein [Bacilli bacterium]|nr:VWA domain-containing protein [Bacilli bacterium]